MITKSTDHGSQEYDGKKGPIARGHSWRREALGWSPKRLVEEILRRVALNHPLLATIWTFHKSRREAKGCGPAVLGMLTMIGIFSVRISLKIIPVSLVDNSNRLVEGLKL